MRNKSRFACPKLVIVSQHFSPSYSATSQLATDLALSASAQNLSTTVITQTPGPTHIDDINIKRPFITLPESKSFFTKIAAGTLFSLQTLAHALVECLKQERTSYLVFSNPPFICLVLIPLKILFNLKYIFVFQDLFPHSAVASGIIPSRGLIYIAWLHLMRYVCKHSYSTIILSEDMRSRLLRDGFYAGNLCVIYNWALYETPAGSKESNPLALKYQTNDCFTIQYSGNFGRLHDLLTILEVARKLQHLPIKFLFIGDGPKKEQITMYRKKYNLTNVLELPFQPRSLLPLSLSNCDVSIVSLTSGADTFMAPSKFYGILASARPVIFIGSEKSSIAEIVQSCDCGFVVSNGDIQSLEHCLLTLYTNPELQRQMSQKSQATYLLNYGRSKSIQKYHEIIKNSLD